MNGPGTVNTAESGSFVGVQAGQVHDSTIYVVGPDDPPEHIYEVGCRYLDDGVPGKAREHIEHACARGHDSPEVRFHHVLAILSKRSYRDLTKKDRAVLEEMSARTEPANGDPWRRGLEVVFALLSCVDGSGGDTEAAMTRLHDLPNPQHDLILRHLGLVLTGSMKQGVWHRIRQNAEAEQCAQERLDRVWAYFEPKPAKPRARQPAPNSTTGRDVFGGVILAGVSLFAVAVIMRSALSQGDLLPLVSCLAVLVLGPSAGRHISSWNHRHQRMLAKEREYGYRRSLSSPPKDGFTDRVDRMFDHYFAKYAPEPAHRDAWLERTRGVRRSLRDEVTRVYRETGVEADQVRWLVRFMVRDVRRRWTQGMPLEPHDIHAVDTGTRVRCVVLCLLLAAATVITLAAAFQQAPVATVGCLLLTVVTSRFAIPLWLRIHSERRRYDEEAQEEQEILNAREAEYRRWKGKLDTLRPSEKDMETWLDADKTLILDETLKHYRLAWHEVAAHAFLPTPKRPCKSAHIRRGPWRYAKYEIRVFLVTEEGVREATATLDFERAHWRNNARINYRFDAVSSVQVKIASTHHYTLDITLTNGPAKSIVVADAPTHDAMDEKSQTETSDINLDAAGFSHTLRILEGIAAEGKPWFERDADQSPGFIPDRPVSDEPPPPGGSAPARNGVAVRERPPHPLSD
ncbi:hypothetical protein [Nocardiopsis sp. FIRDI 009]|uniref:hypothetical protein n=1 Tax=Nocardiopsis sp. FIRDI 009 TaxID=714197 RepID=UPI001E36B40A|nr:hypothetical protein [Nocardiopsis sp. FIRDI 009]